MRCPKHRDAWASSSLWQSRMYTYIHTCTHACVQTRMTAYCLSIFKTWNLHTHVNTCVYTCTHATRTLSQGILQTMRKLRVSVGHVALLVGCSSDNIAQSRKRLVDVLRVHEYKSHVCAWAYVHISVCVCVYIYIYIYILFGCSRKGITQSRKTFVCSPRTCMYVLRASMRVCILQLCPCVYIHVCVCTFTFICVYIHASGKQEQEDFC